MVLERLEDAGLIRFTSHARHKFQVLNELGLEVNERQVLEAIRNPSTMKRTWKDRFVTTSPLPLDRTHILRVIFEKENGNITVITFYPARRARYEGKL